MRSINFLLLQSQAIEYKIFTILLTLNSSSYITSLLLSPYVYPGKRWDKFSLLIYILSLPTTPKLHINMAASQRNKSNKSLKNHNIAHKISVQFNSQSELNLYIYIYKDIYFSYSLSLSCYHRSKTFKSLSKFFYLVGVQLYKTKWIEVIFTV